MRPLREMTPIAKAPASHGPMRIWVRGWSGARIAWVAAHCAATYHQAGRHARLWIGRVNRWLRAILLVSFLFAWLLWLAVAAWLTSSHQRTRAWLALQLRRIPYHANVLASAASIRWQAIRRATSSSRPVWSAASDTADDEFEISQESLDQTALDNVAGTTPPSRAGGGRPLWATYRSPRTRAGRGALIVGTIGLALFVVVGEPSSLLAGVRQWASSLAPLSVNVTSRPQLNASFWVGRRVPAAAVNVRGIHLAPSAASSTLAYACWVDGFDARTAGSSPPPVSLYVTADGARSWQAMPVPSVSAGSCRVVPDAADPQRLLLVLAPSLIDPCAAPRVYDSADRGASWVAVAMPGALANACDLSLYQWHGTIYAWSPSAAAQPDSDPSAQLLVSEDDGGSWQPAFGSAPARAGVSLVASRTDGALLVLVSAPLSRSTAPSNLSHTLWCRAAPGATWQSLGLLPPGASAVFAADGQRSGSGCAWGTLYAASYTSDGNATVTRLESNDGHGWSLLPPLPISGTSADRPLTTDGNVLSVGPDGLLLVDSIYTGPGIGITIGTSAPAHTVWGWDPHTHRWLTDIHIAPANSSIEGFVWDYSQAGTPRLICWVYTLNAGIPAYTGLYRASFAAPSAPSQDSGDQRAPGL